MATCVRVAILGGGVAGTSLLHALHFRAPHLDVHIFESAAEFREAGASVGIARNGIVALDLITPSAATEFLDSAGAVPYASVNINVAIGENQGKRVGELRGGDGEGRYQTRSVHRADLLRELLSVIPSDRLHASKKLERAERTISTEPITLYFTDGAVHVCDVLVGADGIHSMVRKIILGEDNPAASPRNAGWCAMIALKPYEEARAVLGSATIDRDDPRQEGWIGNGTYLLYGILSHGNLVAFLLSMYDEKAVGSDRWQKVMSADEIRKLYCDYPSHLRQGIESILGGKFICDQSERSAFFHGEHLHSKTYSKGSICIIGDAAHATTPFQGSGCNMALEDSAILSGLLSQIHSPTEAEEALQIYDQVRRPRTQRIVDSSRGSGYLMTGIAKEVGLDVEKLQQDLPQRWDFILDHDAAQACKEAIVLLNSKLEEMCM